MQNLLNRKLTTECVSVTTIPDPTVEQKWARESNDPPTHLHFIPTSSHNIMQGWGGAIIVEGRGNVIRCSDNKRKHFEVSENVSLLREFEAALCWTWNRRTPPISLLATRSSFSSDKILLFKNSQKVFWYCRTWWFVTVLIRVLHVIVGRANLFL